MCCDTILSPAETVQSHPQLSEPPAPTSQRQPRLEEVRTDFKCQVNLSVCCRVAAEPFC